MEQFFGSIVGGMILPFVAAFFTKKGFSHDLNVMIVTIMSIIFAVGQLALKGELVLDVSGGESLLMSFGVILTVSQGFYKTYSKQIHRIESQKEEFFQDTLPPKSTSARAKDFAVEKGGEFLTSELQGLVEKAVQKAVTKSIAIPAVEVEETIKVERPIGHEEGDDYESIPS